MSWYFYFSLFIFRLILFYKFNGLIISNNSFGLCGFYELILLIIDIIVFIPLTCINFVVDDRSGILLVCGHCFLR